MTKTYQVSYYLDDMYHKYLVDAENEYEAIRKSVGRLPQTSQEIMHDFKIECYHEKWN